jgi:hypothetical protein
MLLTLLYRLFDERVPIETDYNDPKPSKGDDFSSQEIGVNISDPNKAQSIELLHAPPG